MKKIFFHTIAMITISTHAFGMQNYEKPALTINTKVEKNKFQEKKELFLKNGFAGLGVHDYNPKNNQEVFFVLKKSIEIHNIHFLAKKLELLNYKDFEKIGINSHGKRYQLNEKDIVPVSAFAVNNKTNTVITGLTNGIIKVFFPLGNKKNISLSVDGKEISSLETFHDSDDLFLFSGEVNGRIILWDLLTLQYICIMGPQITPIIYLSYNPESKILISGSADGAMQEWHINVPLIIAKHKEMLKELKQTLIKKFINEIN